MPVERPAVVDADAVALGSVSVDSRSTAVGALTFVSRWQPSAPPLGGQLMRFCGFVGSVTSRFSALVIAAAAKPKKRAGATAREKRIVTGRIGVRWWVSLGGSEC